MSAGWLLAMSFVNPLLVGGLALIAVPILIHILSRRRFRVVEWGAMQFLLEAERENRKRVQFEQWLLLLLRCLAMALLALLLARPFVQPGFVATLLGAKSAVHRYVLIDDSASMGYRGSSVRDFDLLMESTERLLAWLRSEAPNDPVTVLTTSDPATPVIEAQTLSKLSMDDLRSRLRDIEVRPLPANPRHALTRVANWLDQRPDADADVYVLSDYQRSDWWARAAERESAFESIKRIAAAADADERQGAVRVIAVRSSVDGRDNLAVRSIALLRPQTIAGMPAQVVVEVANLTNRTAVDLTLEITLNKDAQPAVPIEEIEPGKTREVLFEITFPKAGFQQLSVGIGPRDPFPLDDDRRVVVPVAETLPVLVVDGEPSSDVWADEVYALRSALAPPGPLPSGIHVEVVEPSALDATPLGEYRAVMFCNAPVPSPAAIAELERYVRRGGGLLIALGSSAAAIEEYNQALWRNGSGVLPAALEAIVDTEERVGVGLQRLGEHPVTAMFTAGDQQLSEYVHFRRFVRTASRTQAQTLERDEDSESEASSRSSATILAVYANAARTPALIERPFGRGRVMLFTSSIDAEWNDWPRSLDGSYVVTMLELAHYLAGAPQHPLSLPAGEPIRLAIWPDEHEPGALFRSPAFPNEPATDAHFAGRDTNPGDPLILEGPRATQLGIYEADLTDRTGGRELRPLAVNLPAAESDLAVLGSADLDTTLAGIPHEILDAEESFLQAGDQPRRELWRGLLIALIGTLLLEQALAWWFGGGSHRQPRFRSAAVRRGAPTATR